MLNKNDFPPLEADELAMVTGGIESPEYGNTNSTPTLTPSEGDKKYFNPSYSPDFHPFSDQVEEGARSDIIFVL